MASPAASVLLLLLLSLFLLTAAAVSTVVCASVTVRVDPVELAAEVDDSFISYTVDASQFWSPNSENVLDLNRPRIVALARALSGGGHTLLRVGGTKADAVYYDLSNSPPSSPPPGYQYVLNHTMWDSLMVFADSVGARVVFGLNLVAPRKGKDWDPSNAQRLLEYTLAMNYSATVAGWELGNEPNLFLFNYGFSSFESGEQLVKDFSVARSLLKELYPRWLLVGPDIAFQIPIIGEGVIPLYPEFMEHGGGNLVDAVTYHFYAMESNRCPLWYVDPDYATPEKAHNPKYLSAVDKVAELMAKERDKYSPGLPIWMGETADVSCGGALNVSNVFVSLFFNLDELGNLARRDTKVVMRQTLLESRYGLINPSTLDPQPVFWSSLLFLRLMGKRVLRVSLDGDAPDTLRVYAHCSRASGVVTFLILNCDASRPLTIFGTSLPDEGGTGAAIQVYRLSGGPQGIASPTVFLNGNPLSVGVDNQLPDLQPESSSWPLTLDPLNIVFVSVQTSLTLCAGPET